MSQSAKLVVFFRAYNDIDHITPVIWKWVQMTGHPVSVVVRLGKDALDDYRIVFLRGLPGVTIHHISEFFPPPPPAPPLPRWQRALSRLRGSTATPTKPPETDDPRFPLTDPARIDEMLDRLFGKVERGVVVFDWVSLSSVSRDFAAAVCSAAKKRGYSNISLPHGDAPYYNKMFKLADINYETGEHFEANPMDVVVVPNALTGERYPTFAAEGRLKVLGSPRYSDEWMQMLAPMLPNYTNPASEGKLKLVLFLRNPVFPIFWEEVINTIRLVTQFPDVYLVVKHHTRGGDEAAKHHREHLEMSKLNQMTAPNLQVVYNDVHSGALLQWTDAVLELGTSIAFEALKLNKPLLALEFLHSNVSTTAHYIPTIALRCKDDLYEEILTLRANPQHRRYTEAERRTFIQQVLDYPDGAVLERYVQALVDAMQTPIKTSVNEAGS